MIGLLVSYKDRLGAVRKVLFQGNAEEAQDNIDRYFQESHNETFISSEIALEGSDHDLLITDKWTPLFYSSGVRMA